MNTACLDKARQNKSGPAVQDQPGPDRTAPARPDRKMKGATQRPAGLEGAGHKTQQTGPDHAGHRKTKNDKAGQHRTGPDRTRLDRAMQDGHEWTEPDGTGKTRPDQTGPDKTGYGQLCTTHD